MPRRTAGSAAGRPDGPASSRGSGLRRDAARNRDRIVAAAHEVFAELGVHAPVEEVARRAGVGVGTVYRRFPDRGELAEAVFVERGRAYLALVDEALRDEDPGAAFRAYLARLCAVQTRDRALVDLLTVALPTSPRLAQVRRDLYHRQQELIRRAQDAGELRADFVPEDVILLLLAHAGLVQVLGPELPEATARFAALVLQALPPSAAGPLPAPPASAAVLEVIQRRPVVLERRPVPPAGGPRPG